MSPRLSSTQKLVTYSLLALLALIILFPIYYMVLISLKLPKDIYRTPSLLPIGATTQNYVDLLTTQGFLLNMGNSLLVASVATIVSVSISCLAAYSLVRLKYRDRDWIGRLILCQLSDAGLAAVHPAVGHHRPAQTRQHAARPDLCVPDLLDAARHLAADGLLPQHPARSRGAGHGRWRRRLQALSEIMLPLSAPGLIAVSVFTFTGAWNELLLALIFITSPDKRTVPVAIQYLITGDVFRWGLIMAGLGDRRRAGDGAVLPGPTLRGTGAVGRGGEGVTTPGTERRTSTAPLA